MVSPLLFSGAARQKAQRAVLLAELQAWEDEATWGAFSTLGFASLSPATIVPPY